MANDWILEVLADMKVYAARNGLPGLECQLDTVMLAAASEIASKKCGRPVLGTRHAEGIAVFHRTDGSGGNAE
ncbi:MAG: hypothetical protein ACE368_00390 [Paracoccaceae bacterium]